MALQQPEAGSQATLHEYLLSDHIPQHHTPTAATTSLRTAPQHI
jgi:hypothetical protein